MDRLYRTARPSIERGWDARARHGCCREVAVELRDLKQVGMGRGDAGRSRVVVIVKIWRVLLCSLLVVSAAAACGTPYSAWSYHEGRRAADRLGDDERYDDAIAAYTELSKKAETQQDLQYLQR